MPKNLICKPYSTSVKCEIRIWVGKKQIDLKYMQIYLILYNKIYNSNSSVTIEPLENLQYLSSKVWSIPSFPTVPIVFDLKILENYTTYGTGSRDLPRMAVYTVGDV